MSERDPLPSWNDTHVKRAILDFVSEAARAGGPGFIPVSERLAVFDNDGTLWCEHPLPVQVYFAQDMLAALADRRPEIRERQPYKAFLEKDLKAIATFTKREIMEPGLAVHSGMTEGEFRRTARDWLAAAENPRLHRPVLGCAFQPQVELLGYLRANGFKTYVVTGGGVDFVRAFAEEIYGIPPEQVIGSSLKTRVEQRDGRPVLAKLPELDSFDDRDEKVVNIGRHLGRHPVLAFGNSDGDLRMLEYAGTARGPALRLLLHHDDGNREAAYDRDFKVSPLDEALDAAEDRGILVVSMKDDWKAVFPDA